MASRLQMTSGAEHNRSNTLENGVNEPFIASRYDSATMICSRRQVFAIAKTTIEMVELRIQLSLHASARLESLLGVSNAAGRNAVLV
jgi:hypothetical protein